MKGRALFLASLISTFVFSGCHPTYIQELPNAPLVEEILADTASEHYIDFSSYPESIAQLPIGILTTWDEYDQASFDITNLDAFNNITGEEVPDDILDFAGEHFSVIALRDSLSGNLKDTAVIYAAKLLQQQVKAVIIASHPLSDVGVGTIRDILRQSGKNIMVLGVNDSTDYSVPAAMCYRILRNERNLALRITPQTLQLIIIPEIECSPLQ